MKKKHIIIFLIIKFILFLTISFYFISSNIVNFNKNNSDIVDVKLFVNSSCKECTKIEDYLKVYKKSGVTFGKIDIVEYNSKKYYIDSKNYDIQKLPFIVFSKELNNYKAIKNSWNDTFGYKNNNGEFIVDDIIPPYFDLETKKIKGLIDFIYIGNTLCDSCYKSENILTILNDFGLKFNNIKKISNIDKEGLFYIKKYNIKTLPVVILSTETKLYENFSFFWKTIGNIESDGNYILRNSEKLGLNINNKKEYE